MAQRVATFLDHPGSGLVGKTVEDARGAREGYGSASSASFDTVRQLRVVLTVASRVSKYWLVSFVRARPFGQHR
jgi:hypothetical protein